MRFRLLRVDIEIQMFFWITTVILGIMQGSKGAAAPKGALPVWVAVVFVSVLVHELGHAIATMRHGIEPKITLHGMGGTTSWTALMPLGRRDQVVISAAGPFAGFAFGGLILAAVQLIPHGPLSPLAELAIRDLKWVNFGWGLVNLIPVLPFDGGHILEQTLGPKRARLTAIISLVVALAVAGFFMWLRAPWGALLFGMSAMRSYRRLSPGEGPPAPEGEAAPPDLSAPVPPELAILLEQARRALLDERLDRAIELGQQVIEGNGATIPVPPRAVFDALQVIAWAHLLAERTDLAQDTLIEARRLGEPEASLAGAVLLAKGELAEARRVLEAARAAGDHRKEIAGSLIQALIGLGEVAGAAAIALGMVESLSGDDVRTMARIAFEGGAFEPSARLYESAFARGKAPDDAYQAARAESQGGRPDRALAWLRRAIEAGFTDGARAWSDAALEPLRGDRQLEALWPRP